MLTSFSHALSAPTSHTLYNRLRSFLKQSGFLTATIGKRLIYVKSGMLTGYTFIPNTNYCSVIPPITSYPRKKVTATFNFHCNYSVTVLLYKLYKHAIITIDQYTHLLSVADAKA